MVLSADTQYGQSVGSPKVSDESRSIVQFENASSILVARSKDFGLKSND